MGEEIKFTEGQEIDEATYNAWLSKQSKQAPSKFEFKEGQEIDEATYNAWLSKQQKQKQSATASPKASVTKPPTPMQGESTVDAALREAEEETAREGYSAPKAPSPDTLDRFSVEEPPPTFWDSPFPVPGAGMVRAQELNSKLKTIKKKLEAYDIKAKAQTITPSEMQDFRQLVVEGDTTDKLLQDEIEMYNKLQEMESGRTRYNQLSAEAGKVIPSKTQGDLVEIKHAGIPSFKRVKNDSYWDNTRGGWWFDETTPAPDTAFGYNPPVVNEDNILNQARIESVGKVDIVKAGILSSIFGNTSTIAARGVLSKPSDDSVVQEKLAKLNEWLGNPVNQTTWVERNGKKMLIRVGDGSERLQNGPEGEGFYRTEIHGVKKDGTPDVRLVKVEEVLDPKFSRDAIKQRKEFRKEEDERLYAKQSTLGTQTRKAAVSIAKGATTLLGMEKVTTELQDLQDTYNAMLDRDLQFRSDLVKKFTKLSDQTGTAAFEMMATMSAGAPVASLAEFSVLSRIAQPVTKIGKVGRFLAGRGAYSGVEAIPETVQMVNGNRWQLEAKMIEDGYSARTAHDIAGKNASRLALQNLLLQVGTGFNPFGFDNMISKGFRSTLSEGTKKLFKGAFEQTAEELAELTQKQSWKQVLGKGAFAGLAEAHLEEQPQSGFEALFDSPFDVEHNNFFQATGKALRLAYATKEGWAEAFKTYPLTFTMGFVGAGGQGRSFTRSGKAMLETAKSGEATPAWVPEALEPKIAAFNETMSGVINRLEEAKAKGEPVSPLDEARVANVEKLVEEVNKTGDITMLDERIAIAMNPTAVVGKSGQDYLEHAGAMTEFLMAASAAGADSDILSRHTASFRAINDVVEQATKEHVDAVKDANTHDLAAVGTKEHRRKIALVETTKHKVRVEAAKAIEALRQLQPQVQNEIQESVMQAKEDLLNPFGNEAETTLQGEEELDVTLPTTEGIQEPVGATALVSDGPRFNEETGVFAKSGYTGTLPDAEVRDIYNERMSALNDELDAIINTDESLLENEEASAIIRDLPIQLADLTEREYKANYQEAARMPYGAKDNTEARKSISEKLNRLREITAAKEAKLKETPKVKKVAEAKASLSVIENISTTREKNVVPPKSGLKLRKTGKYIVLTTEDQSQYDVEFENGMTENQFLATVRDFFGEKLSKKLTSLGILNIATIEDAKKAFPELGDEGIKSIHGWRSQDGKTYAVVSSIQSKARAVDVVLHEIGIHNGLKGFLGDEGWKDFKHKMMNEVKKAHAAKDYNNVFHKYLYAMHKAYSEHGRKLMKSSGITEASYKKGVEEGKKFHQSIVLANTKFTDFASIEANDSVMEEFVGAITQSIKTVEGQKDAIVKGLVNRLKNAIKNWFNKNSGGEVSLTREQVLSVVYSSLNHYASQVEKSAGGKTTDEIVSPSLSINVTVDGKTHEVTAPDKVSSLTAAKTNADALQDSVRQNAELSKEEKHDLHVQIGNAHRDYKKAVIENERINRVPTNISDALGIKGIDWFYATTDTYLKAIKAARVKNAEGLRKLLKSKGLGPMAVDTGVALFESFNTFGDQGSNPVAGVEGNVSAKKDTSKQIEVAAKGSVVIANVLVPENAEKAIKESGVKPETEKSVSEIKNNPKAFGSTLHTFANRAVFALLDSRMSNLSKRVKAFVADMVATKNKFAETYQVMSEFKGVDNKRLGFMLGWTTVNERQLTKDEFHKMYPQSPDKVYEAYISALEAMKVGRDTILDAAKNMNDQVMKRLEARQGVLLDRFTELQDQIEEANKEGKSGTKEMIELKNKLRGEELSRTRVENQIEEQKASYKELVDILSKREFYWPLSRFGKFKVEVKDKKTGERVGIFFMEDKSDASKAQLLEDIKLQALADAALGEAFKNDRLSVGSPLELVDLSDDITGQSPFNVDGAMLSFLDAAQKISEDTKGELEAAVMSAKAMETLKNHMKERKGIPGWSTDAFRVFDTYIHSLSSNVANMKHSLLMDDELKKFTQENAGEAYDSKLHATARGFVEHAKRPPDHKWVNTVLGAGFVMHIGARASFAVAQLGQLAGSVYPALGQFYGYINAMQAITAALPIAIGTVGWTQIDKFELITKENVTKWVNERMSPDAFRMASSDPKVRKHIATVCKEMVIRAADSGSLQAAPTFGFADNIIKSAGEQIASKAGVIALKFEQINRLTTLISWGILNATQGEVKLSDSTGFIKETAASTQEKIAAGDKPTIDSIYDVGETVNELSNYIRGRGNQPKYLRYRGGVGAALRLAFNYKSFPIGWLTQFHALGLLSARKAGGGKFKQTLAYARPQLVGMGVQAMIAGPKGIMYFKLLEMLLSAFDEPEEWMLNFFEEVSKELHKMIRKGMKAVGMDPDKNKELAIYLHHACINGLPTASGIDPSAMFEGDLVTVKGSTPETVGNFLMGATGSSFAAAIDKTFKTGSIVEGMQMLTPSAIKGPVEAISGETSVGGGKVELTTFGRAARALGFQPTSVQMQRDALNTKFKVQSFVRSQGKEFATEFAKFYGGGKNPDNESIEELKKEVKAFNTRNKELLEKYNVRGISASEIMLQARSARKNLKVSDRIVQEGVSARDEE